MTDLLKWFEDPAELRRIRKRLGLTQKDLANKAGVKRSLIANIEAGRRRLSEDIRNRIWQPLTDIERERRNASHAMPLRALGGVDLNFDTQEELSYHPLSVARKRIAELEESVRLHQVANRANHDLIAIQEELIQLYGEQAKELLTHNKDLEKKIGDLKTRINDLHNLLGLETDAALARDKADESREKIKKSVTAPEGGE